MSWLIRPNKKKNETVAPTRTQVQVLTKPEFYLKVGSGDNPGQRGPKWQESELIAESKTVFSGHMDILLSGEQRILTLDLQTPLPARRVLGYCHAYFLTHCHVLYMLPWSEAKIIPSSKLGSRNRPFKHETPLKNQRKTSMNEASAPTSVRHAFFPTDVRGEENGWWF